MSPVAEVGFRKGVRLGVDWGYARVGVAACDADGLLCYPLETVRANDQAAALARVAALADQMDPLEIVFGLPLALNGKSALAANNAQGVAKQLAARVKVPVRLVDERLTTAEVNHHLSHLDTRKRRKIVDQAAAAGILEGSLTYERHTGSAPGQLVESPWTEGNA